MFLTRDTTLQNNKYRIDHILGQGGFGITYQGRQTGLDRLVAIKEFFLKDACERKEGQTWVSVSQGNWERTKKFRQKFLKEAQMIAKLRHPRIIRIIDVCRKRYHSAIFAKLPMRWTTSIGNRYCTSTSSQTT